MFSSQQFSEAHTSNSSTGRFFDKAIPLTALLYFQENPRSLLKDALTSEHYKDLLASSGWVNHSSALTSLYYSSSCITVFYKQPQAPSQAFMIHVNWETGSVFSLHSLHIEKKLMSTDPCPRVTFQSSLMRVVFLSGNSSCRVYFLRTMANAGGIARCNEQVLAPGRG